jgi:hypothetical protein
VDAAPTLALLLGLSPPAGSVGAAIPAALLPLAPSARAAALRANAAQLAALARRMGAEPELVHACAAPTLPLQASADKARRQAGRADEPAARPAHHCVCG